jgi:hypothetical protein
VPKLPYIKFYPDDWMNDMALRQCSRSTRATWMDLLCLAQQGEPYGHLRDASGPLPIKFMANWCGISVRQFLSAIDELEAHKVFSRMDDGTMYSRRMVRDEKVRVSRASGGAKSLENPNVPQRKDIHEGYPYSSDEGSPLSEKKDVLDPVCVTVTVPPPPVEHKTTPRVVSISEKESSRFEEFWEKWPRKTGRDAAAMAWMSHVTTENEDKVFACLDRFLASNDVARGAVPFAGITMGKPGWIASCAKDSWECDWPKARDSPKPTPDRRLSATDEAMELARELDRRNQCQ